MKRDMKIVRALLMIPVAIVLLVSVAGCGIISDQAKQDAKKKVEARKQQVEQKIKKKAQTGQKNLENKVDELIKKLDAQEKQNK